MNAPAEEPTYRCASPACPGFPHKASDMAHPANVCVERVVVVKLARGLTKHQRDELCITFRDCTDESPAECDRRIANALVRKGLAAQTSLRGPRWWMMFYLTPLGHAVAAELEKTT